MSVFDACHAGARPKMSPVRTDSDSVKMSTERIETKVDRERNRGTGGLNDVSTRISHHATSTPKTPPEAASRTFSASNCRTSTRASRPEREADADLTRAGRSTREQQVRHVRARRQQHQADDHQQHGHESGDGAGQVRMQPRIALGHDRDRAAGAANGAPLLRICGVQLGGDHIERGLRLRDADAGAQAGQKKESARRALIGPVAALAYRQLALRDRASAAMRRPTGRACRLRNRARRHPRS